MRVWVLTLLLLPIVFASCKNKRALAERDAFLTKKEIPEIVQKMKAAEYSGPWLSIKMDVAFKSKKKSDSFKMYARMKQDSAIWVSATYFNVEVARFLFKPDSLYAMNKKDQTYYIGSYDYLSQAFNVVLDFEGLQALILGNDPGLDANGKIKTYSHKGLYYLNSGRLRSKDERQAEADRLLLKVGMDPESFKINKVILKDLKRNEEVEATYSNFEEISDETLPKKVNILFKGREEIAVENTYLKVTADKPYNLSFRIPEKYAPMQ